MISVIESHVGPLDECRSRSAEAPQPGACQFDTRRNRILIVDDELLNVKLMTKQLVAAGYANLFSTTSSQDVLDLVIKEDPDVLLLDIVMPGKSGLEILHEIRRENAAAELPVIMVTASYDRDTRIKALELGATDFISKPTDPTELVPRIRNALMSKHQFDHLKNSAHELERQVQQRTEELEKSRMEVLLCLGTAAEFRDNDTGMHVARVGKYAGIIARELDLGDHAVDLLEQTAPLHDLGKIGIPDAILLKPGKLTENEFQLMREHAKIGSEALEPLDEDIAKNHAWMGSKILGVGRSPILKLAASIALTHHEKWDGTGYPNGLKGEEIPLEGRITAVADVFDALSSSRPYKPAFDLNTCFRLLKAQRGKHFDPAVLDAFLACKEEVEAVYHRYQDETSKEERSRHALAEDLQEEEVLK
jgi:putative two-component system response regulator